MTTEDQPEVLDLPEIIDEETPGVIEPELVEDQQDPVESVELLQFDYDGKPIELSLDDIPSLYEAKEKMAEKERILQQREAQLGRYSDLLNVVESDEWTKQLVNYRLQGNSPKKILEFLNNFYEQNPMPEEELDDPVRQEIADLKRQLAETKAERERDQLLSSNTNAINVAWNGLGLKAEESAYPKIIDAANKVGAALYGEQNFDIMSRRLTKDMAETILERTKKSYPQLFKGDDQQPKAAAATTTGGVRRIQRTKTPITQLPGNKGANLAKGSSTEPTEKKPYTARAAKEAYEKLFG